MASHRQTVAALHELHIVIKRIGLQLMLWENAGHSRDVVILEDGKLFAKRPPTKFESFRARFVGCCLIGTLLNSRHYHRESERFKNGAKAFVNMVRERYGDKNANPQLWESDLAKRIAHTDQASTKDARVLVDKAKELKKAQKESIDRSNMDLASVTKELYKPHQASNDPKIQKIDQASPGKKEQYNNLLAILVQTCATQHPQYAFRALTEDETRIVVNKALDAFKYLLESADQGSGLFDLVKVYGSHATLKEFLLHFSEQEFTLDSKSTAAINYEKIKLELKLRLKGKVHQLCISVKSPPLPSDTDPKIRGMLEAIRADFLQEKYIQVIEGRVALEEPDDEKLLSKIASEIHEVYHLVFALYCKVHYLNSAAQFKSSKEPRLKYGLDERQKDMINRVHAWLNCDIITLEAPNNVAPVWVEKLNSIALRLAHNECDRMFEGAPYAKAQSRAVLKKKYDNGMAENYAFERATNFYKSSHSMVFKFHAALRAAGADENAIYLWQRLNAP